MSIWIDGRPTPQGSVSVLDQTFQRGDGCFEALRSYRGRLFDIDGHLDRLERSCRALVLPMPARTDLVEWLERAAADGGDCVVRLILTRGPSGGSGHAVVITEPLPDRPTAFRLATVEAPWHPAGRDWELAGVKSVSYAPNMAASRSARRAGAHDALLVSDSVVLEGPTFSVGWVVDGMLETPSLDLGVLASVTRRHVIRLAGNLGIPVMEGRWSLARLEDASEVMVWSTIKEVSPVESVDGLVFELGPITASLSDHFRAVVSR